MLLVISTIGVSTLFMETMDHQLLKEQNCNTFLLLFLKQWTKTSIVLTHTKEFNLLWLRFVPNGKISEIAARLKAHKIR